MSAAEERKKYLIKELARMGIYQTRDKRSLYMLRLAELEWLHIEAINDKQRREQEEHERLYG